MMTGNGEDRFTENFWFESNAYTKNNWYQTLGIKIQKVSNEIHRKTLRGGNFLGNFSICCNNLGKYSWIRSRF